MEERDERRGERRKAGCKLTAGLDTETEKLCERDKSCIKECYKDMILTAGLPAILSALLSDIQRAYVPAGSSMQLRPAHARRRRTNPHAAAAVACAPPAGDPNGV